MLVGQWGMADSESFHAQVLSLHFHGKFVHFSNSREKSEKPGKWKHAGSHLKGYEKGFKDIESDKNYFIISF